MRYRPLCLIALVLPLFACDSIGAAATGSAQQPSPLPSTHDWPTFNRDISRSGASPDPTGITAANIASMQRQQVRLDGTVDAAPIYLHGVSMRGAAHNAFFVTTIYGKTIAIDADDGTILWTFTPSNYSTLAGSPQVTTATPVADDNRQSIYAASPDGRVQKLAVADGRVEWSTAITRLPQREKIASPLTSTAGKIIAVTGGYIGDAPPYQGHVAILDAATGRLEHVWNSLCSDRAELLNPRDCPESDSAIWGRAGAVVDPATGNIFVATGNAKWDGKTNWGDSTIELDPEATRMLANYTPSNTEQLNETDRDIGSTSPVRLGGGLLAQGGKDGLIRLLSLEKIRGTEAHRGGELQTVPTPSGRDLFTAPAVLHSGSSTWIFAADNGATAAWTLERDRFQQRWKNDTPGTSPVVAGGLLYVYSPRGGLHVYEPQTGKPVAALDCGGGHWNSPIVIDGRIALPEGNSNSHRTSGVLNIWRLPQRAAGK
jgi:outer membrane protein assembly factor BamB